MTTYSAKAGDTQPLTPKAGHNSAAFDQQLESDLETVLSDDHETVFHYAQWHIGDYVAGTRGMSLEHEGAYIRFLMRLYERGKPLPDDDRFMATCMALSIRVWRRIKQMLIQFGKIVCRNGCLTNARFEKERWRRAAEIKKQADAARKGWDRKRAEKAQNAETSPKVSESLPEVWTKFLENFAEKCSKINGRGYATRARSNNHYPITIDDDERARVPEPQPIPDDLSERLCEAVGDAIVDPCIAPGLLILSDPIRWLESGCHLKQDILPAIRATAARARRKINSWAYFSEAVFEARDRRLAPAPEPIARAGPASNDWRDEARARTERAWAALDDDGDGQ